jgi:replicative DNA helicase
MGKSTVALDFARAAAIHNGLSVAIFSLEMSEDEIGMRVLSAEARVALHHLRGGTVTDDDWARIGRRLPDIGAARLHIDDSPGLSMADIRARSRRLATRDGLDLIVVDYLQLVTPASRRGSSRQEDVAAISRHLKLLAKELRVPVIALSQLNRGSEQREDKRPVVSDLRESAAIENDADMVILLHRADAYERESPRAGEAELIVGKHRNGPIADITVAFQGHYSRFVDMAQT